MMSEHVKSISHPVLNFLHDHWSVLSVGATSVGTLIITSLDTMTVIGKFILIFLSAGYAYWRWRAEYNDRKNKKMKENKDGG